MEEASAYGLWSLVIINSLVFIIVHSCGRDLCSHLWRLHPASASWKLLQAQLSGGPWRNEEYPR